MDNLENPIPTQSEEIDWKDQVESLRRLLTWTLFFALVVAVSFDLYLWRQFRFVRSDLAQVWLSAPQIEAELNKNGSAIQDFLKKLNDYGKSHADFGPISKKFHLDENAKGPTPVGVQPKK